MTSYASGILLITISFLVPGTASKVSIPYSDPTIFFFSSSLPLPPKIIRIRLLLPLPVLSAVNSFVSKSVICTGSEFFSVISRYWSLVISSGMSHCFSITWSALMLLRPKPPPKPPKPPPKPRLLLELLEDPSNKASIFVLIWSGSACLSVKVFCEYIF